jgi:O-antigen/teichoic acid export membrane protein
VSLVRNSLLLSFASRYTVLVIRLGSTVIIARLLTPEDIGIFSVGVVLVGLAHRLRDFGVGQYVIQERELSPERIRTAFGVTLLLAWGLAVVLFLVSGPVAEFYREEGVRQVMLVLALTFVLLPFGSVVVAMLNRAMNFAAIYRIRTASAAAHALAAIALAAFGFGFMSLAWAALVGVAVTILVANLHRPAGMPLLPSLGEWRRVASFGGMASVATFAKEIGTGAPDLIIGKALNMASVGLFGRAMGLIQLFEQLVLMGIKPVVLPHFSAEHRAGAPVRDLYLRSVALVSGLAWPFFAVLALLAYPTIRILYGPQWDAAVPVAQVLCVYGAVSALFYFSGQVFVALGAVRKHMMQQLILQPIVIVLVLIAAPHGLEAVGYALGVGALVGFLLTYRLLRRVIDVRLADFVVATRASLGVTLTSVFVPAWVVLSLPIGPDHLWLPFLLGAAGAGLGWLIGVHLFGHPLKTEVHYVTGKLRERLPGFADTSGKV